MPRTKPIFILFRSEISSSMKAAFRRHFDCHLVPVLKFKKLQFKIPKRQFDFLLITSQTTLKLHRKLPQARNIILMGDQTASLWNGKRPVIIQGESSDDILNYFRNRKGSILFLRSKLGDPKVVEQLRRGGRVVCVRHVYETKIEPPKTKLKQLLSRSAPGLFLGFLSPSGVLAVRRTHLWNGLMKKNPTVIAIGKTTKRALEKYGIKSLQAAKPEISGILATAVKALKTQ